MCKKYWLGWMMLVLLVWGANAAEIAKKPSLSLAVSEGSSGGINAEAAHAKYQPLADVLGSAIHADIKVVFVRDFARLANGMKENQFDLVLARPSDYPARGMRDHQYRFVASASPEGQCALIVHKDSPPSQGGRSEGQEFHLAGRIGLHDAFLPG